MRTVRPQTFWRAKMSGKISEKIFEKIFEELCRKAKIWRHVRAKLSALYYRLGAAH
jgi:hypothetical protein